MQQQRTLPGTAVLDGRPTTNDETSDDALIGLVAAGSRAAMRALYARHHVRVYRFVLGFVADRALAEDLTSDVFLEVWRHAGRFQRRSTVATWLLAIARFKAISAFRRRTDEALDDAAAAIADPAGDPERALEKKDRTAILLACLRQLSPIHREVVLLAYGQERSVEEVVEIVGVPPNTVKTRMFHARRNLSQRLRAAGVEGASA